MLAATTDPSHIGHDHQGPVLPPIRAQDHPRSCALSLRLAPA